MRQLSFAMEPDTAPLSSAAMQRAFGQPSSTGSLTEVIVSDDGAIQPIHLLPMLANCGQQNRWLMWLSPNRPTNKRWLESMGLKQAPVIHIDVCNDTQLTLCNRIMASGNSHMIVEWQGALTKGQRESLKDQARSSGSQLVIIQRR